jgi:hypothetical protein
MGARNKSFLMPMKNYSHMIRQSAGNVSPSLEGKGKSFPRFEKTRDWIRQTVVQITKSAVVKSPLPGGEDLGEGGLPCHLFIPNPADKSGLPKPPAPDIF